METLKETPYLLFQSRILEGKKTRVVSIVNIHHDTELGVIKWYPAWRQYCFFPHILTIWNKECLNSVNEVIKKLMDERKGEQKPVKKIKVIGVVALSVEDFLRWKQEHKHTSSKKHKDTIRDYTYRGKRYVCLSKLTDTYGFAFDEIQEAGKAYLNDKYREIFIAARQNLISKKI
jgi:hypothetical protein